MKVRTKVGLAAAAMLVPAALSAQDVSADVASKWAAIEQCAQIDTAEERHACMDGVIRRAGLLSDVRVAQTAREDFGNENRVPARRASEAEGAPVTGSSAAAVPAPVPARSTDIDELVTAVLSARIGSGGRLAVTTAEGSVWEQVQSETFRIVPKAGDSFTIDRTALGGFRCRFEKSTIFRCRRTD